MPRPSPSGRPGSRPRLRLRPRASTLVGACLGSAFLLGVGACSGSTGDSTPGASSSTASTTGSTASSVHTTTTVRSVTGRLSPGRRHLAKTVIAGVVDRWFDAAYPAGTPPVDVADAFGAFTAGAARRARQDAGLMSDARLGDDVTSVTPMRRRLRLDVLAIGNRPVGVTAQFLIRLRVAGTTTHREQVTGHLYLTHTATGHGPSGRWQIFGYDAQRGQLA